MNFSLSRRVSAPARPFADLDFSRAPWDAPSNTAHWIAPDELPAAPFVVGYRLRFSLQNAAKFVVHVSADERYELLLNGERIGRGPTRGDAANWFFESYELDLGAGEHILTARVWSLGHLSPLAQMSVSHGFLLLASEPLKNQISTGIAPWETKILGGYRFAKSISKTHDAFGVGAKTQIVGSEFDWDLARGDGWARAQNGECAREITAGSATRPPHALKPSPLPAMLENPRHIGTARFASDDISVSRVQTQFNRAEECDKWTNWARGGGEIILEARQTRRVLIDLEDYFCAYPQLHLSGGEGAKINLHWAESLFDNEKCREKGDRNAFDGKYFSGFGATFWPDGAPNRTFETLWWECGRWIELRIETAEEPLVLHDLTLRETHYPLHNEGGFAASDARLAALTPCLWRSLQMNAHETYMDCPFFEQLMYIGDLALQALTAYPVARDARLAEQAIRLVAASRGFDGFLQSRYPSREPQFIPSFSPAWIGALYNHCLWRGNQNLLREMMPTARAVVDAFGSCENEQGLIGPLPGWNFVDWVENPAWRFGIPPDGADGASAILGWQFVAMLRQIAQLEAWCGETELAARAARLAKTFGERLTQAFWNPSRGIFADDLEQQHFSQHAQALAILSGQLSDETREIVARNLENGQGLTPAALFFGHYVWEALREAGRGDDLVSRLDLWFAAQKLGVKCTLEDSNLNGTRSDCHGWTAHPLFHFYATILGVRPASFGFESVEIAPVLGDLSWAHGTLVHPQGEIRLSLEKVGEALRGEVELPSQITGVFQWKGREITLHGGKNRV